MAKDDLVMFSHEFDGVEHLIAKDQFGVERDFIRPNNIMVISENNTYPVKDCKEVDVQLPEQKAVKLQIAENGEFTPDTYSGEYYNDVTVQMATELTDEEITITENGTYKPSTGKMFSKVTVDVPCDTMVGYDEWGDPVTPYVDPTTGKLEIDKLPDHIKVTINPTKTDYLPNETIDYSGIEVRAYNKDGSLWTKMGYKNGVIPYKELIFPVSVIAPVQRDEVYDNGKNIKIGIPYTTKQIETVDGNSRYLSCKTFAVAGIVENFRLDGSYYRIKLTYNLNVTSDYGFGFLYKVKEVESDGSEATRYFFVVHGINKTGQIDSSDLDSVTAYFEIEDRGKHGTEEREYSFYRNFTRLDDYSNSMFFETYKVRNNWLYSNQFTDSDIMNYDTGRFTTHVEFSGIFNEMPEDQMIQDKEFLIGLISGSNVIRLQKNIELGELDFPVYYVTSNDFGESLKICYSVALHVISVKPNVVTSYSMTTKDIKYTLIPSQNRFLFVVASNMRDSLVTVTIDKYNIDTGNEETAESYIRCTHEYEYNNRKVYYSYGTISVSGNITDAQPVALETDDTSLFYNNANKIAWLMCYGNISGNYDAVLSVPVQWKRPSDRKLLETSLNLHVNVG